MRIVDKYELAKCPYGTPFYDLKEMEVTQFINGHEEPIKGEYEICSGIRFLTSLLHFCDDKPYFNGVLDLESDYPKDSDYSFNENNIYNLSNMNFSDWDDSSVDYSDEARFLVLDKKEFKIVLDLLQHLYNSMGR